MKMNVGFIMAMVLFLVTSTVAFADGSAQMGRKTFSMSGEFIEFVSFPFTVPSGNCGNLKTFEYMPGYGWNDSEAYWQELVPGSQVASYSAGLFKFVNSETACNPEFVLEGELSDFDYTGNWGGYGS